MIRVAICDDHKMVREALASVLGLEDEFLVVGVSDSMESTRDLVDVSVPDVFVVDVRLETESGLDVARMVAKKFPHVKMVVLTSFKSDEAIVEAYEIGASAFILKSGSAEELITTIRDVAAGLHLINPGKVREAAAALEKKGTGLVHGLDASDRQIARLISQGYSDKQISDAVFLGLQTVRNRVSRLLSRFEKDNRTQLALLFAEYHDNLDD